MMQTKTKKRRSKLKQTAFAILIISILGLYVVSSNKPDMEPEPQAASAVTVPSRYDMSSIALPENGQTAVAVAEESMNIHASDDQIWPMASITKIITALAILEKAPIEPGQQGDTHVLNQQDEDYYWDYAALLGTLTPITAGYEMTQYEILQTMLLASSNNMTDTLVDRYFESREDFMTFTNNLLESYGLQHTRVADATGFSPDSVSTPTEMVQVGKIALENPVIAEIVAQPSASPRVAGWIPNYNVLIEVPGVTGIKPGLTDESGHNLLFSFEAQNKNNEIQTVIAVVMGMFDRSEYILATTNIIDEARHAVAEQ